MNCKKIKPFIDLYLDGETGPEETALVEDHALSCSSCRQKILLFKELKENAGQEAPPISEDFRSNTLRKIRQADIPLRSGRTRILPAVEWRWALALASLAVILTPFIIRLAAPARPSAITVRFEVNAPGARNVSLAGDFNKWDVNACVLSEENGLWAANVSLKPGRYQYMFVIDGSTWIPDPRSANYVDDGYGNKNSVLDLNEVQI